MVATTGLAIQIPSEKLSDRASRLAVYCRLNRKANETPPKGCQPLSDSQHRSLTSHNLVHFSFPRRWLLAPKPKHTHAPKTSSKKKQATARTPKSVTAPLPVTLLSGFLGAGKTTVLKHILESNVHRLRIAVIVNDMTELNIDTKFVRNAGLIQTKLEVVSLQNGCVCCTLRGNLIREIAKLQRMHAFDYLVIESTGIAEPMPVAESFVFDANTAQVVGDDDVDMLWDLAALNTCVTVVDALEFPRMFASTHRFDQDQLLVEQVEFANIILVNKADLVPSSAARAAVVQLVQKLNPHAKVILTTRSSVPLDEILHTAAFDLERAKQSVG
ncbi:Aste57867_15186 [Aphanomyces stellatus]|uniref:Aste57867_15186 protein n=1 Tax=Aphanomyces stellatus TaxID=120398 RepID=A0A485L3U6_9STRA|nr:hypothetical protein As57867_015130 [Aphanomyces stellatus]VFT91995.1 Aste57867_15186 [Aphanomyces stellatus]